MTEEPYRAISAAQYRKMDEAEAYARQLIKDKEIADRARILAGEIRKIKV